MLGPMQYLTESLATPQPEKLSKRVELPQNIARVLHNSSQDCYTERKTSKLIGYHTELPNKLLSALEPSAADLVMIAPPNSSIEFLERKIAKLINKRQ